MSFKGYISSKRIVTYCRKVYVPRHPEFGACALARKYGVTRPAMSAAICGKNWSSA